MKTIFSNVAYKTRNLIRWLPVIWNDFDWDYAFLLRIMEFKFRNMADCLENGFTTNRFKTSKRLRIAAHLCHRLRKSSYYHENAKKRYKSFKNHRAIFAEEIAQQDADMLGLLISKHLRTWWD
jgi:hypothetical protein